LHIKRKIVLNFLTEVLISFFCEITLVKIINSWFLIVVMVSGLHTIQVPGMGLDALGKNYTVIPVDDKSSFFEMALNSGFNQSPGSVLVDQVKSYFFKDLTCYFHRFRGNQRGY